jgi:hypothetical protein
MIRTIVKWTAVVGLILVVAGFLAFLYFIPPLLITPAEQFAQTVGAAPPPVASITDPAERTMAERGRYIVMTTGCIGCHATNGSRGPDYSKYLAGGGLKFTSDRGTFVSRNLTPDPETGLARRTDEEVKRVLRSGLFPDGHVVPYTMMPWASFSNWTEEDRHAVVVYLRHLPAVRHRIPDPIGTPAELAPGAVEQAYGVKDYGVN